MESVEIKSDQKWKELPVDPVLLDLACKDGFCGIEELTDYDIIREPKTSGSTSVERQNKKRKREENVQDDGESAEKPATKKTKSKVVKKAKKSKVQAVQGDGEGAEKPATKKTKSKAAKKANGKQNGKKSEPALSQVKVKKSYDKCDSNTPAADTEVANPDALEETTYGWKDLFVPEPVIQALTDLGYFTPTSIQALTLPSAIRDGLDIVGAAETGSGKTLAFGIPIIHNILRDKEKEAREAEENQGEVGQGDESDAEVGQGDESDAEVGQGDESDAEVSKDDESNAEVSKDIESDAEVCKDDESDAEVCKDDESDAEVCKDDESNAEVSPQQHKGRNTKLRCLIMTPTRELAIQIKDHLVAVTKYTDIKIAVIVGGLAPQKQYRILKRQPEIVIGTPGRLWELIEEGEPHLATVTSIKYLVIDEADRLLEKGHFEELLNILQRINSVSSEDSPKAVRQTFVFSATLTLIHALPQRIVEKQKKRKFRSKQLSKLEKLLLAIGVKEKRKIVDITRKLGTAEALMEARITCSLKDKDVYLYYFLTQYPGRTLVFCNSIDCVRRLNNIFSMLQRKPWPLHAQMHQKQRLKNLERFTASTTGLLLATDVAARGLDIPSVEHVIHYQVPRTAEAYIHRSGRTARATKEGLSIMLIEPNEMQLYRRICKTLGREKDVPVFPVDVDTVRQAKVRVDVARKLDLLEHRSRKQRSQNNWFEKAAEDMDIELDREEHLKDTGGEYIEAATKREMKQLQLQLNILLKSPILPQTLTMRYPTYGNNLNAMLQNVPVPEKAVTVMKKENKLKGNLLTEAHSKLGGKKSKGKKKYRKRH